MHDYEENEDEDEDYAMPAVASNHTVVSQR